MKMFTTIAVTTALLGLAACSKNEPAAEVPAPAAPTAEVTVAPAPAENASAPVDAAAGAKPVDAAPAQPK